MYKVQFTFFSETQGRNLYKGELLSKEAFDQLSSLEQQKLELETTDLLADDSADLTEDQEATLAEAIVEGEVTDPEIIAAIAEEIKATPAEVEAELEAINEESDESDAMVD